MVQYITVILSIYAVVINAGAAIMGYLLSIPFGMKTDIEVENNIVGNAQKIDILSPNIAMNGDSQCETWESFDFELFEWLVLGFLAIALMNWGLVRYSEKRGY